MSALEKKLQTEIRDILDQITEELCAWLDKSLSTTMGDEWFQKCVKDKLIHGKNDPEKLESGEWTNLSDLDLLPLLKVAHRNWEALKFRKQDWRLVVDMKDVRGRHHGHRPAKGLSLIEVVDDLKTLAGFVQVIPFSDVLVERVKKAQDSGLNEWLRQNGGPLGSDSYDPEDAAERNVFEFGGKLRNEFKDLTPSQETAVTELQNFLEDRGAPGFILKGYAGTGKTHLIGGLVNYLRRNFRNAILLAPTGRAARVLSERHGIRASTIHKGIYFLDELIEYKPENDPTTYKFYFDLQVNEHDHGTIFIVDEASMISDIYSEQEFIRFGSGQLLKDLLAYIGFDGNDALKKVIFVGDTAQLPPIGMSFSPGLSKKYLAGQYRLPTHEVELTDVLRQQKGSAILNNATRIRDMLRSGRFPGFDFEVDDISTFELNPNDAVETYLKNDRSQIDPNLIIVTHSNAQAADYNTAIRAKVFPDENEITANDRIIIVKNNYNYEIDLMNGQIGRVKSVGDEVITKKVPLGYEDSEGQQKSKKHIPLSFRKATVTFTDLRGEPHDLDCMLLENLLYNKERALSSDESKALYAEFKMRHPHLNPKQSLFKEYLKADPYFNALQIKFAYALTCHKSQGGEWPEVIVDFEGKKQLNTEGLKWSYTAITRAQDKLYAIAPLHKDILTPVKPIEQKMVESNGATDPDEKTPKDMMLEVLTTLFKDEYQVACIHDTAYHLQYSLASEAAIAKINIHYNGKRVVTKAWCFAGPDDLKQGVDEKLNSLKGQNLGTLNQGEQSGLLYDLEFFAGDESLLAFHEALSEKAETCSIKICSVHCYTEYHLGYDFSSETYGNHTVNYYFNDSGTLQKVIPKSMSADHINDLLKALHGDEEQESTEGAQIEVLDTDYEPSESQTDAEDDENLPF